MNRKILVFALLMLFAGTAAPPESFAAASKATALYSKTAPQAVRRKRGERLIIHRRSGTRRTAVCRDGAISLSRNRRGTCSHHGGVRRWL